MLLEGDDVCIGGLEKGLKPFAPTGVRGGDLQLQDITIHVATNTADFTVTLADGGDITLSPPTSVPSAAPSGAHGVRASARDACCNKPRLRLGTPTIAGTVATNARGPSITPYFLPLRRAAAPCPWP